MIGQHFYECIDGRYSFSLGAEALLQDEAEKLCNAMIEGMLSGYFQVVAHPDRMFRKCEKCNATMEKLSCDLIHVAGEKRLFWRKIYHLCRRMVIIGRNSGI